MAIMTGKRTFGVSCGASVLRSPRIATLKLKRCIALPHGSPDWRTRKVRTLGRRCSPGFSNGQELGGTLRHGHTGMIRRGGSHHERTVPPEIPPHERTAPSSTIGAGAVNNDATILAHPNGHRLFRLVATSATTGPTTGCCTSADAAREHLDNPRETRHPHSSRCWTWCWTDAVRCREDQQTQ